MRLYVYKYRECFILIYKIQLIINELIFTIILDLLVRTAKFASIIHTNIV